MSRQEDILEVVFENFLSGSKIFKEREALRHEYVPNNLPHRDRHIKYLAEILAPSLVGYICSNVLIYGKTGTGKTAVVKFVLEKLLKKTEDLSTPIIFSFINCRIIGTEYRILSNLCYNLNVDIPFTGLATAEVFDRFKEVLDNSKLLHIVVLDEIDTIVKKQGDSLLYELSRINENLNFSKIAILGISNDLKFKDLLDPRVLSSLSEEEIVFHPYNADELSDILEERARIGFLEGVIGDGVIQLCSALAASEHGDARRALDLLRVAGEIAERKGESSITDYHIREAQKRIEHDRVIETIKGLPTHSKILLLSAYIFSRKNIHRYVTGDIYNLYCELCEVQGLTSLTQRRIGGLISELDLIGLLNSKVVSLGRYGRTRKSSLGISRRVLREALSDDRRLESLINYNPKYIK